MLVVGEIAVHSHFQPDVLNNIDGFYGVFSTT